MVALHIKDKVVIREDDVAKVPGILLSVLSEHRQITGVPRISNIAARNEQSLVIEL